MKFMNSSCTIVSFHVINLHHHRYRLLDRYAGPTADAVPHMTRLGFKVPQLTSSSEFLLDLVNTDFYEKTQVER
jgi:hypothetical protein